MLRLYSAKTANRQWLSQNPPSGCTQPRLPIDSGSARPPHQPAQPLSGPPGPSQRGGHTLYLAASGQKQGYSEAPLSPQEEP